MWEGRSLVEIKRGIGGTSAFYEQVYYWEASNKVPRSSKKCFEAVAIVYLYE